MRSQYIDEWGNHMGYCNDCGEEAELFAGSCCEDGEIVAYEDDNDPEGYQDQEEDNA